MLERLLNNRKEWNALKEQHEAKMAAIEEAKKAKEEAAQRAAAAKQGKQLNEVLRSNRQEDVQLAPEVSFETVRVFSVLMFLFSPSPAAASASQSKTCAVS